MSQNQAEQLRYDIVTSAAGNSDTKLFDGVTDMKIKNMKIYDTSSSADGWSTASAGDVIMMSGWDGYEENNRIFTITEVESNGAWVKVDKEVKDDLPTSAGVTVYTTPESFTVTGISTDDVVVDAYMHSTADSSPNAISGSKFAVTAADTVSSFNACSATDQIMIVWADLSAG